MPWIIPSFKKGLVDKASRSKLTDDYKTRCAELTNMYISKDDSIKIRPPAVLEDIDIPVGSSIIDYRILSDNTVVHIREANIEDIADLPRDVRNRILKPGTDGAVAREGGDQRALRDAYHNIDSATFTRKSLINRITTIIEQGSVDGVVGSPLLLSNNQRVEYKMYILQAGSNSHPLLVQRRVGQENNGAASEEPSGVLPNLNDGTSTEWTIKYRRTRPITYVYVSGVEGTDIQSRYESNSNSLALNVEWDNLLTQFELFEDEVYFIFAGNYFKVGTGTNILNVDSGDLLVKSLNNNQLESKLIPTKKQLWNLRDLPIKVLDVQAPGFDYDTKSGNTSYDGRVLSDGLTSDDSHRSAGVDTRPSDERAQDSSYATNTTDKYPDYQPNLEWIPGTSPYKATTGDNNDHSSRSPMGIYKPNIDPTEGNSATGLAMFNTRVVDTSGGGLVLPSTFTLPVTIRELEEFLSEEPNLLNIIEYLNPCITHYEQVSTPSPGTNTESYNLFPDLKMTKKGTNFIDWHHPIFSYGSDENRHYVFAVPNEPQEILSDRTAENNRELFALGNGKTTGGLGVRIDIQTGNFLEIPNDHSTAVYNKFGNFFPSALNPATGSQQPRTINSLRRADEANRGKTVRTLYFYYDYTNSAVQNALDTVEYIGAVINDGEELHNCILSESTDSYVIEDTDRNKRSFTNADILNGIRYAKYPRLQVVRVNDNPSFHASGVRSPKYAWSFLPYFMPEEIVGIGKRYSVNKLGPFAEIKSIKEFNAYRYHYLDSVHSLERDGFPFDIRLISPGEELQLGRYRQSRGHFPDYPAQVTGGVLITPISFLIGRGMLTQGRNVIPVRTSFSGSNQLEKRTFYQNISNSSERDPNNRITDNAYREGYFIERMITGLEISGEDDDPRIENRRRPSSGSSNDREQDSRLTVFNHPIITSRSVIFNPTFLRTKRHTPKQLIEGSAVIDGGALQLSRKSIIGFEENRNYFANTIQDYLAARPNANEESFLEASGIDLSLTTTSDGGNRYQFLTPRGQDDLVKSIIDDSQQLVVGLENSIRTLSSFGVARETIVSNAGTTSDLATESRYIIGANKDDIFQLSYYEEAGGFVYNVVNTDLNPGSEFNMIAGLFGRHKLYFFGQSGTKELYALAMGTGRSPKGVSKLVFDFNVHEVFHFTQDKLALRSENKIYTLDFSKEAFREDGLPEVYEDDPAGSRTQPAPFMCAVQSLPILEVDGVRPTPFDRMNIIRAAVGTEGFVDFEFSIVNAQGRKTVKKGVSNRKRELEYTSGLTLIEGLHASGTAYPSIRIEKQTSKYLAISSVILENKNSRGQE